MWKNIIRLMTVNDESERVDHAAGRAALAVNWPPIVARRIEQQQGGRMRARIVWNVTSLAYIAMLLLATLGGPHSPGFANEIWKLESTYSRGNDDRNEDNYETGLIEVVLDVYERPGNMLEVVLTYEATLSTDHAHGISGGDYSLKQRFNEIEPNLTASSLSYTPGSDGSPLGGTIAGRIVLGEISRFAVGPRRGRIDVTLLPDYDPSQRSPVDSVIEWGIHLADGGPEHGHVTLTSEWKGPYRAPDEVLRLVHSSFIPQVAWRARFAH